MIDNTDSGISITAETPSALLEVPSAGRCHLERALERLGVGAGWHVEHLALKQLRRVDDAQSCRLVLWVAVYLHDADAQRAQLDLELTSTPWQPAGALPPLDAAPADGVHPKPTAGTPAEALRAPLRFTLSDVSPRPAGHPRGSVWLHYVDTPATWLPAVDTDQTLPAQLEEILTVWLRGVLSLDAVAGAEEALLSGPVGHFGTLEACVLERSGQADLAVEATLLGSADDGDETGGEATTFLDLYGERLGVWLLHRRTLKLLKPPRKDAPAPRQWHSTVLIAPTAEALIAQTELTPTEKRLFQAAGILPHASLRPAQESAPAPTTALDLSGIADRPRRHLQAIVQLAQQGQLDATDIDLLLKTARQLGKAKPKGPAPPRTIPRTPPRR